MSRAPSSVPRLLPALLVLTLSILLFSSACSRLTMAGTPRPDSLSDWRACLLRDHTLGPPTPDNLQTLGDKAYPETVPSTPDHAVLFFHARWGESWIRTEYTFGELMLAVHAPFVPGATQTIELDSRSELREGSLGWVESCPVTGTLQVVEVGADSVKLALALSCKGKDAPLNATVAVPIVSDRRACYS